MRTASFGFVSIAFGSLVLLGAGCASTLPPASTPATTADTNDSALVQPLAPPTPPKQLLVVLDQVSNSKENGAALLTEENGKTRVTIMLSNATKGSVQPVHIHLGACPAITAVKYSLNDVVDGASTTLVESTFDQLVAALPLSLNVHKSATDLKSYVACGEIKSPALTPVVQNDGQAVKKFVMTANQFTFTPSTLTVNKGDTVQITLTSADVNHGMAIPTFNVNQTVDAGKTATFSFVADQAGSFPFFCNVFCGEGHRNMKGVLTVK